MRFHLIDRVDDYTPASSVRARKLTSHSEEYWEPSLAGDTLAMPAPLVLEALCQAGTWLVMLSTDTRKRAALLSIGSVAFFGEVHPGDVLEIEGLVDSMNDEVAVVSGRVTVAGKAVLEAKDIMCVLIDADDLEDVEATRRMQKLLTRAGGD
jgi:3-hydroxyacyl-[acyl-carrier-protein] dehydratase